MALSTSTNFPSHEPSLLATSATAFLFHKNRFTLKQDLQQWMKKDNNSSGLCAFSRQKEFQSRRCSRLPFRRSMYFSPAEESFQFSSAIILKKLQFAANDDDHEHRNDGVYVDFGSIPSYGSASNGRDEDLIQNESSQVGRLSIDSSLPNCRSNHWIVLIDDEPAIRFAIGDYLHSMGYSVSSADGPMAFLELLFWSCAWSLVKYDKKTMRDHQPPPWIDNESHQLWRLPSCVISDIRMPGGIDGVQLLELLRCAPTAAEIVDNDDKRSKKKRGRPKKVESYMDDFVPLESQIERIITPVDQAMQYLDEIWGCIDFCVQAQLGKGKGNKHQHPSSLQQVPVILLTAKAMVSDRIVGYKAGANGYLPKPFRPEELLGMVDRLMRKQEKNRHNLISTQVKVTSDIQNLTPEEAREITTELVAIKKLLQGRLERERKLKERMNSYKLRSLLPEAMWMLRTGECRKRVFTKEHIRSILIFCFTIDFPKNNIRRSDLFEELQKQIAKHPEKLENYLLAS